MLGGMLHPLGLSTLLTINRVIASYLRLRYFTVMSVIDKMPFRFTGTLKKFVVILEPETLTEEEREHLREEEARACLAVH